MKGLGLKVSKKIVGTVGTWGFVCSYITTVMAWVLLHKLGILHFDPDLSLASLALEFFAGVQASIILIHDRHLQAHDRARDEDTHSLAQMSVLKTNEIYKNIAMVEELLEDLAGEVTHES
jgi:uncharacterized membrane protein